MGNGVRGDLQELAAECRQLKTFHLRLQRPRDVSNSKLFAEYAPTVPRKNVVQGKVLRSFTMTFALRALQRSQCQSVRVALRVRVLRVRSLTLGGPRGDSEAPFLRCGPPLP